MQEQQVIIIAGNPVDGLTFTGPFDSSDDANAFIETTDAGHDIDRGEWWTVELAAPETE